MKIKTGILLADPNDAMNQNNAMLIVCDVTDLPSMLLNFVLALMMKKAVPTQMLGICARKVSTEVSLALPAMHRKCSTIFDNLSSGDNCWPVHSNPGCVLA